MTMCGCRGRCCSVTVPLCSFKQDHAADQPAAFCLCWLPAAVCSRSVFFCSAARSVTSSSTADVWIGVKVCVRDVYLGEEGRRRALKGGVK